MRSSARLWYATRQLPLLPSLTLGPEEGPSPPTRGRPPAWLTSVVVPVTVSYRYTLVTSGPVKPPTRSGALLRNARKRPSALRAGLSESPAPAAAAEPESWLTSVIVPRVGPGRLSNRYTWS